MYYGLCVCVRVCVCVRARRIRTFLPERKALWDGEEAVATKMNKEKLAELETEQQVCACVIIALCSNTIIFVHVQTIYTLVLLFLQL